MVSKRTLKNTVDHGAQATNDYYILFIKAGVDELRRRDLLGLPTFDIPVVNSCHVWRQLIKEYNLVRLTLRDQLQLLL